MRTQTRGKFENVTGIFSTLSGLEFSGYEIHMGKTTVSTGEHQTPLVQLADGRTDGVQRMEKAAKHPAYTAVMCTAFLTMETLPCA